MKRLHVHISVDDLDKSVGFYSVLFGTAPSVLKDDYAKWALDDPRVNFALSKRARNSGLDHLGIQVDDAEELEEVAGRLAASGAELLEQKDAACCYARSDKAWVNDPQGIAWETFRSHGEITVYGENAREEAAASACCADVACGTGPAEAAARTGDPDKACCG
ncbi:ArsI/CadI family heavy metal resistance metalloenzyme [Pelagibius sp. CAU 1746]|uniref:ArsI/CadI family heavy metal resistance metalloenzyme n=1 Tax=Pelagibius sp. CAU 1746 TaxID=3140370 RepID=UPI00325BCD3E